MLLHPLKNNRGLALIFMVLLFTAAATAAVMFISLGVKVKGIQKEGTTQQRLSEIRTALQNYYLIHYDLPDPSLTNPPSSVPTVLLNLPQKYRFDSNGQRIRYDRVPGSGHMTTVRNIQVHGTDPENLVAAVLVAPGPDKQISTSNQGDPYDTAASDDLVLEVSLEAEALKIANHTVSILQQTAKAYDETFYSINNDADTLFLPPVDILNNDGTWDPGTEWFDNIPPCWAWEYIPYSGSTPTIDGFILDMGRYRPIQIINSGPPAVWENADYGRTEVWYSNYAGTGNYRQDEPNPNDICITNGLDGRIGTPAGNVPDNDEDVVPRPISAADPTPIITDADMRPLETPVPIIDEGEQVDDDGDGVTDRYEYYPEATGGSGQGCVRFGVLTNDPSRGVFSLDRCSSGTPAYDLAVAYGLNLFKLGYDSNSISFLDPWGQRYLWGQGLDLPSGLSPYGGLPQSSIAADDIDRDPHYWTFFSTGPDGARDTSDDILPPADRIPGYFLTPQIANPLP